MCRVPCKTYHANISRASSPLHVAPCSGRRHNMVLASFWHMASISRYVLSHGCTARIREVGGAQSGGRLIARWGGGVAEDGSLLERLVVNFRLTLQTGSVKYFLVP